MGGCLHLAVCGAGCSLGAWWHLVQLSAVQQAPWEGHFSVPALCQMLGMIGGQLECCCDSLS